MLLLLMIYIYIISLHDCITGPSLHGCDGKEINHKVWSMLLYVQPNGQHYYQISSSYYPSPSGCDCWKVCSNGSG